MSAKLLSLAALCAVVALPPSIAVGEDKKEDPKKGKQTYVASGESERGPEFGEVWFDFSVDCKGSAEDVRQTIDKVSARVWATIAAKIPAAVTETNRRYWGNIENVKETDGSELQTVVVGEGPMAKQKVKHVDLCNDKELPLGAQVPSIFSGAQRFGVRAADLDWLEALVKSVNALPRGRGKHELKITAGKIEYQVGLTARRKMLDAIREQARVRATGPGSKFKSDEETLKFASAHLVNTRIAAPPVYRPTVGESVERGKAPKVTLTLPLVYTIYSEAGDVTDPKKKNELVGLTSEYELQGKAIADADYVESSTLVSARCQVDAAAATKAVTDASAPIVQRLERFHGARPSTEKDRFVNNEAGSPTEYYPYQPVEWEKKENVRSVTKYLNLCDGKIEAAPASGSESDLPAYWQASRTLQIKSSNFTGALELIEGLRKDYAKARTKPDATRVAISNLVGQVTEATKEKLYVEARKEATSCVLAKDGALGNDVRGHQLSCAYLKNVREGVVGLPRPMSGLTSGKVRPEAAFSLAPPGGGGPAAELELTVTVKPNEQRPTFGLVRHFAFDYEFTTVNYATIVNPALPAPRPVAAPPVVPPTPKPVVPPARLDGFPRLP